MPKSPMSLSSRSFATKGALSSPRPKFGFQALASTPYRSFVRPSHTSPDDLWFTPSSTRLFSPSNGLALESLSEGSDGDRKSQDRRILKLGRTLRILSPLLPTILVNPLPLEILSPSVTLHLFPSTHPHLPTVKGRVLYRAALWTVPVAWSSVPLVGNVKLQIVREKIIRAGSTVTPKRNEDDCGDEKLVVRWETDARHGGHSAIASTSRTEPPTPAGSSHSKNGTSKGLSSHLGGEETPIFKLGKEEQFTGLFIFSFDEEGRISSHTIEHADEANGWDRTAKFVILTDWLLGKARGSVGPSPEPGLAVQGCQAFCLNSNEMTIKAGLSQCQYRKLHMATS